MNRGKIYAIPSKDNSIAPYAFIRGDDGKDYFLHKSELVDSWDTLKGVIKNKGEATIDFEFTMGGKGLRAVGAAIVHAE